VPSHDERRDDGLISTRRHAKEIDDRDLVQSVGIIHDADECHDETLIQLHGGHVVRVPCPLDEVLAWCA
jgi:hypothetical protein